MSRGGWVVNPGRWRRTRELNHPRITRTRCRYVQRSINTGNRSWMTACPKDEERKKRRAKPAIPLARWCFLRGGSARPGRGRRLFGLMFPAGEGARQALLRPASVAIGLRVGHRLSHGDHSAGEWPARPSGADAATAARFVDHPGDGAALAIGIDRLGCCVASVDLHGIRCRVDGGAHFRL